MDQRTPLNGSALDREIGEALDVDPSPDFLARVRQRIAAEPAPAYWWRRPPVILAAGAVVLAVAIWSMPDHREPPADVAAPTRAGNDAHAVAPSPTRNPEMAVAPASESARGLSRPAARAAVDVPADNWDVAAMEDRFAVVIIAENERKALQWLGASTRVEPAEPAAITVSAQRAPAERPALPPVNFDAPEMDRPVFEPVSLE
jgi:hypothetical protein